MRNIPGNIIQFPESTLLVDTRRLQVPFDEQLGYYYTGVMNVGLEEGYIYHVTSCAIDIHTPDEVLSPIHGNVRVFFARQVGHYYLSVATVGYDFVFPPYASQYSRSELLDLWLWGNVRISVAMTLAIDTLSYAYCEVFLGKYRR
jgi:hypothetical protein